MLAFSCVHQVEVHQHQFPITYLAESFEHEIHPYAFTGTVDFLANVSCVSAEFQRPKIFEWNKCHWHIAAIA